MAYYLPPGAQSHDYYNPTELRTLVTTENWDEVIKKYQSDIRYHKIRVIGKGTALHIATTAKRKEHAKLLVKAIIDLQNKSCLETMNERGATALHLAAYRGLADVCEVIIGREGERKYLIQKKNRAGETPLFWAVCGHKILVYIYLQQFHPRDFNIAIDVNETSILHIAVQRDMFDLAYIIMHFYRDLIKKGDKDQITPLAYLATRRSTFHAGSMLPWWKKILFYCPCIHLSSIEAKTILEMYTKKVDSENNDQEYTTVKQFEREYKITSPKFGFRSQSQSVWDEIKTIKRKRIYCYLFLEEVLEKIEFDGDGDDTNSDIENNHGWKHETSTAVPTNQQTSGETSTQETNKNIEIEDSKHTDGEDTAIMAVVKSGFAEIMDKINTKIPITSDKNSLVLLAKNNEKRSAYLNAASHGIIYMMARLAPTLMNAIDETNSNDENALLLAVKNRQPFVIEFLLKRFSEEEFANLALQLDKNENTLLHLAACTPFPGENTWRISGFALQMMWDIKWYKYIKHLVPDTFVDRINKQGKTPSEIFKEDHKELLQKSVEWMRDTAESCSVVAALIAGVSFATSGSVPGGNQQSGEPTLEGQPAFEGFAISSLIGLYFSVISLIMFLSILTSRKEVEDFCLDLPMKLLFGLSSLFVSIVSMLVSFCAGHFFVLTHKYGKRDILFYLYVSILLPVAFYAFVQFPLFLDLVLVIFKKVPPPSIKGVLI